MHNLTQASHVAPAPFGCSLPRSEDASGTPASTRSCTPLQSAATGPRGAHAERLGTCLPYGNTGGDPVPGPRGLWDSRPEPRRESIPVRSTDAGGHRGRWRRYRGHRRSNIVPRSARAWKAHRSEPARQQRLGVAAVLILTQLPSRLVALSWAEHLSSCVRIEPIDGRVVIPPVSRRETSGADATTPGALLKSVVAQASFFAALMFYAGVLYTSAYYGFFHLSTLAIGFTFAELVIRSLRLVTVPALVVVTGVLMVTRVPHLLTRLPEPVSRVMRETSVVVARWYLVVLLVGFALLIEWRPIQLNGWGWLAPVTLAAGLLLSQTRAANGGRLPTGIVGRVVPMFAAGVFLLWAVALIASRLGVHDARSDAEHLIDRTAVVVFSAQNLMLSRNKDLHEECLDLGVATAYRCRYTGLRLLVERGGRYHLLPVGWKRDTDPIYVIKESDGIRVELMAGTR